MSADNLVFVAWEEHIISHEKGNRIVHYYLKHSTGDLVLAVRGYEKSIRHMIYVVSDEFLYAYGPKGSINMGTKWRARREVVDWLNSLVSIPRQRPEFPNPPAFRSAQYLGSQGFSKAGFNNPRTHLQDQMIQVQRKFKVQHSEIEWSGDAWICCKQLKHYPAFRRNGIKIAVHSFVFIMAEEDGHYLGYLEDLYEDKKRQKRVKVRWFHRSQEVNVVIPELNPHPREVFITPHVQVISAECIDGLATILTPKHYEKCLPVACKTLSSGIHMCFRQFKSNEVKPFSLSKLCGYSNQSIFSSLDCGIVSKQKTKICSSNGQEEKEFTLDVSARQGSKRSKSCKGHWRLQSNSQMTNSDFGNQIAKSEQTYKKLKIRLKSERPLGIKLDGSEAQHKAYFKFDEKIELLCQDSGLRGCWFRCKVLQVLQKRLKVQYNDVQDVDGSGNLEEWVPASRVAYPDKLGMRISGRLIIRPWPPEDSSGSSFKVGAAVDVWWSDGWWEGAVTGVDISGSDSFHVYLPGEDKFLTLQRKNIRTSRDWVDNRWVNVQPKPDIISVISSKLSSDMKFPVSLNLVDSFGHCGSAFVDCGLLKTLKRKTVEEDARELPGSTAPSGPENVIFNLKKWLRINYENEVQRDFSKSISGDDDKVRPSQL
ncbi:hypothetical protein LguiB_034274 [Lonicera macranthoides]